MTLFRSFIFPAWLIRAIVTALVGAGVTGAAAWGTYLTDTIHKNEQRIAVSEDHVRGIDRTLDHIQATVDRIEEKMDRAPRRK